MTGAPKINKIATAAKKVSVVCIIVWFFKLLLLFACEYMTVVVGVWLQKWGNFLFLIEIQAVVSGVFVDKMWGKVREVGRLFVSLHHH